MAKKNKTDNLLRAVEEYSTKQREELLESIAATKKEAFEEAEKKSKIKADKYIVKQVESSKVEIASEFAVKNLESQGNLFKLRSKMTDEIFDKAKDKLIEYTKTAEYKDKLLTFAKEIAETFGNNSCVVYLNENDAEYFDDIKTIFSADVTVEYDDSIKIGGIKGYCQDLKIIADNTLDTKLMEAKDKFAVNSNLKIV